MVIFNTLEDKVWDIKMSEENETKNMIQGMAHAQDCIKPEITIEYVTINPKNDTYGTKKKIIAGCACGSKVSMDTGNSGTQYSVSAESSEAISYY